MIGRVAGAQVAVIARFVIFFAWRERAQAERGQKIRFHHFQNAWPLFLIEDRMVQRNCEDLIGAQRVIVAAFAIDYIVQIISFGVPEALLE